jgi:hypothetical protein
MNTVAVNDLSNQYRRAFQMLYEEVSRFDARQWVQGLDSFLVPAKLAMHIVDCLDYYSCGQPAEQYRWGHRFGGGWWEMEDGQMPDQAEVLAYAHEIEARVLAELGTRQDEDLVRPFPIDDGSGVTWLGHHVYALRHTMHHHGELAALAVYHGREGGSWA